MFKKINQKQGFTLIEIITVVAIIVIISGATFYNFQINKKAVLEAAANDLIANVKRVQQMSMGINQVGVDETQDCPAGKCVFGFHFGDALNSQTTQFIIFIDKSDPLNYEYDAGIDKVLKVIEVPKEIHAITVDATDIAFESPYGKGIIADENIDGTCSFLMTSKNHAAVFSFNIFGGCEYAIF